MVSDSLYRGKRRKGRGFDPTRFRAWVEGILEKRGKAPKDFAAAVGVSRNAVYCWLNGSGGPRQRTCKKIAAWGGVSENYVRELVCLEPIQGLRYDREYRFLRRQRYWELTFEIADLTYYEGLGPSIYD